METITKSYATKNGLVEGIQVKWPGFNILLVSGSKAALLCGAFDLDAFEKFGYAAALVESTPDNPIGTLERFPNRKIRKSNLRAQSLGIKAGMDVLKAFELIA